MRKTITQTVLLASIFCITIASSTTGASARKTREQIALEKEAEQLATELLDGRMVNVRVYPAWRDNPRYYRIVSVPMKGLVLDVNAVRDVIEPEQEPDEPPLASEERPLIERLQPARRYAPMDSQSVKWPVVVVLGSEQQDKIVAQMFEDWVYIQTYLARNPVPIWHQFRKDPGPQTWSFCDGLGDPIPNATVDIFLREDHYHTHVHIGQVKLDRRGQTNGLKRLHSMSRFVFLLSHPDYGIASVELSGSAPEYSPTPIILPLVTKDSEAYSHSLHGVVTDTEGHPVPNTTFEFMMYNAVNNRTLKFYGSATHKCFTDERGTFAIYPPVAQNETLTKDLIPLGTTFRVLAYPPDNLDLRSAGPQHLIAGTQTTITLERVNTETYFRRFIFEDYDGTITDPEELKKITVSIARRGVSPLQYSYDQWKDGGQFPFGKFSATKTRRGDPLKFESVEVNSESPEEIVFITNQYTLYRGRVVNGLTGESMPNIIVGSGLYVEDSRPIPESKLTSYRAKALSEASQELSIERLHSLQERVALTDEQGNYEFEFFSGGPAPVLRKLTAFEKDFLPSSVDPYRYQSRSSEAVIELPAIKMYPAASITIEPDPPFENNDDRPKLSWEIISEDMSARTERTTIPWSGYRGNNRDGTGNLLTFYVPAEVDLNLEFTWKQEITRSVPVRLNNVRLQQGQTLDLGKVTFEPMLRVTVKIVDADGQPARNVKLACQITENDHYLTDLTDAEGVTSADIPPNSKGQFVLRPIIGPFAGVTQPAMPWEVGGQEDQGKSFVFRLPEDKLFTFKGQVLNGVTSAPMPGAIVLAFQAGHSTGPSNLTSAQWNKIRALKAPLNINDPSLADLKTIFSAVDITQTDTSGRFQFTLSAKKLGQGLEAGVISENFLGTEWPMQNPSPDPQSIAKRRTRSIELDEQGNVILPPLRMFPAAKLVIQTNLAASSLTDQPEVRSNMRIADTETDPWIEHLKNANFFRDYELRPNTPQTIWIVAGASFDLDLYEVQARDWIPLRLGGLRLQQGETQDLGQVTFQRAMPVMIKVIDPKGKPVPGVEVSVRRRWGGWLFSPARGRAITDNDGMAQTTVFPNATVEFIVFQKTRHVIGSGPQIPYEPPASESAEYNIGGPEDKDKEFILQLSDKMLQLLSQ
jgi:hypothetical protein